MRASCGLSDFGLTKSASAYKAGRKFLFTVALDQLQGFFFGDMDAKKSTPPQRILYQCTNLDRFIDDSRKGRQCQAPRQLR
ncbi:hypothetical protein MnTg02_01753 [bacterium MnTg02]|nr:hypothetical protein MnTg02_01753 [bacterium MnTg02]